MTEQILSQVTNHGDGPLTVLCRDGSELLLPPQGKAVCEPLTILSLSGPAHWSLGPPDRDLTIAPSA